MSVLNSSPKGINMPQNTLSVLIISMFYSCLYKIVYKRIYLENQSQ